MELAVVTFFFERRRPCQRGSWLRTACRGGGGQWRRILHDLAARSGRELRILREHKTW